jgi:hypothetical protein
MMREKDIKKLERELERKKGEDPKSQVLLMAGATYPMAIAMA